MNYLIPFIEWVVILLFTLPFYRSIWFSDWYVDELPALVRNGLVNGESPMINILTHDFWGAHLWAVERATHKSFRPVTTLVWRIVSDYVGRPSPFHFRLLGCLGHSFASVLLQVTLSRSWFGCSVTRVWRLIACILFASHPVHTENIVYCVGFADTLSTIFLILALLVAQSGSYRLSSTLLCFLSSLSKESGFVSFAIVLLVQVLRDRNGLSSYKRELAMAIAVPVLRYWYVGGSPVNFAYADVPYIYEPDSYVRGLSYLHVHSIYGRLLVLPWNMSWDYSFDAVPIVQSMWDLRILGVIATYLAVFAFGFMSTRKVTVGILSLSLFVLPFVPASSLFLAVGTVVGERLLYPVTFGLAVLVAVHGTTARHQRFLRRIFTCLCLVYFYLSWSRVSVWSSKLSLYSTDAKAWPRSCKTLHQYGAVLMNSGPDGLDSALPVLQQSLKIFDDNALTDYLISQIYIEKGDLDSAIAVHNKIAAGHGIGFTDFSRFMFLVDAGYALVADGRYGYEYPRKLIEEGLEIYGFVSHARNALGVAYLRQGNIQEAIEHLEFAAMLEQTPSHRSEAIWLNLCVAYALIEDEEKSMDALSFGVEIGRSIREAVSPSVVEVINWLNGKTENPPYALFYTRMT